ncbi:hypothetical protein [Oligoflexus tunisiensis]|uniref:hypothetical protein n=1 Tax=Oligoflexus tunisiensis TaxID=708132 RepID=UPI00114CC3B0|nr:hypothetical protein [Oligoflexus tunisiensis]
MKNLGVMAAAVLALLFLEIQAAAATVARPKTALSRVVTHQIRPRDTLRAGQDIELRKVQAMLSRQGPPQGRKPEPRR